MTSMNEDGHFRPLHDGHAIEQLVFVIQFQGVLDDAGNSEIEAKCESFKKELPAQKVMFGVSPTPAGQIVVMQGPGSVNMGSVVGHLLQSINPDGSVSEELRVEPGMISYRSAVYSRWSTVWARARRFLGELLPIYASSTQMIGLSLNYVDRFIWEGRPENCRPSALLRQNSPFVSPHVFGCTDLWHSHFGTFDRYQNYTKRLLNFSLDCLDEFGREPRRIVVINSVIAHSFFENGYDRPEPSNFTTIEFAELHFAEMHTYEKEVLGQILNDSMKTRIALEP